MELKASVFSFIFALICIISIIIFVLSGNNTSLIRHSSQSITSTITSSTTSSTTISTITTSTTATKYKSNNIGQQIYQKFENNDILRVKEESLIERERLRHVRARLLEQENPIYPHVNMSHHHHHHKYRNSTTKDFVDVVSIVCGQMHSTFLAAYLVSMRKACVNSTHRIRVTIFADDKARDYMKVFSNGFDQIYENLNFQVVNINRFQASSVDNIVGSRFSCTMYKLNLLKMMAPEVKRVIVLDVDTVIREDLVHLWDEIHQRTEISPYNTTRIVPSRRQLRRLSESSRNANFTNSNSKPVIFWLTEALPTESNWYNSYNVYHYYPPSGLNSGIFMQNLDAMRQENFTVEYFVSADDEKGVLGEQGYIDNWAHYHTDRVVSLPCKWNTREGGGCDSKWNEGIFHGPNGAFLKKLWYVPYEYNNIFNELHKLTNASTHQAWLNAW